MGPVRRHEKHLPQTPELRLVGKELAARLHAPQSGAALTVDALKELEAERLQSRPVLRAIRYHRRTSGVGVHLLEVFRRNSLQARHFADIPAEVAIGGGPEDIRERVRNSQNAFFQVDIFFGDSGCFEPHLDQLLSFHGPVDEPGGAE